MEKLTVTVIAYADQIKNAKEQIQELMEDCPYNLRVDYEVEEAQLQSYKQYVVTYDNGEQCFPNNDLGEALKFAKDCILVHGSRPSHVSISLADVHYLEGEFDYVGEIEQCVLRSMKGIVDSPVNYG